MSFGALSKEAVFVAQNKGFPAEDTAGFVFQCLVSTIY